MSRHQLDRPDLFGAVRPKQDRHRPPAQDGAHLGRGHHTEEAGRRPPSGEAPRHGKPAARGGDGRRNQHGHRVCGRATAEGRGAPAARTEDYRHRSGLRKGAAGGPAVFGQ